MVPGKSLPCTIFKTYSPTWSPDHKNNIFNTIFYPKWLQSGLPAGWPKAAEPTLGPFRIESTIYGLGTIFGVLSEYCAGQGFPWDHFSDSSEYVQ